MPLLAASCCLAVMFMRVLVLVAVVNRALLMPLLAPFALMAVVGLWLRGLPLFPRRRRRQR